MGQKRYIEKWKVEIHSKILYNIKAVDQLMHHMQQNKTIDWRDAENRNCAMCRNYFLHESSPSKKRLKIAWKRQNRNF